jgi:hypothetical protein
MGAALQVAKPPCGEQSVGVDGLGAVDEQQADCRFQGAVLKGVIAHHPAQVGAVVAHSFQSGQSVFTHRDGCVRELACEHQRFVANINAR